MILVVGHLIFWQTTTYGRMRHWRIAAKRSVQACETVVKRIARVANQKGFSVTALPQQPFYPDELDPMLVAAEWGRVQLDLELLLTEHYGHSGGDRVRIPLIFEPVDSGTRLRAVFPEPLDPRTRPLLIAALRIPKSMFTNDARIVSAAAPVWVAKLRDEFLQHGTPNFLAIRAAVEDTFLHNASLSAEAKLLGGELRTVLPASTRPGSLEVITSWQLLTSTLVERRYWRAHFLIYRDRSWTWVLETRIDIGRRLRSQSPDQIVEFINSHALGDYVAPRDIPGIPTVSMDSRQNVVTVEYPGPGIQMTREFLQTINHRSAIARFDEAIYSEIRKRLCQFGEPLESNSSIPTPAP